MTTHADIITRAGPKVLAAAIGIDANNVYQWRRNNSIPAAYFKTLAEAGISTLNELAEAAALKRTSEKLAS